ncbi:hypothetical protein D9M68_819210 [compost metagenome]
MRVDVLGEAIDEPALLADDDQIDVLARSPKLLESAQHLSMPLPWLDGAHHQEAGRTPDGPEDGSRAHGSDLMPGRCRLQVGAKVKPTDLQSARSFGCLGFNPLFQLIRH